MKQFLRFSFLAAVLSLLVVSSEAQNFQPFRKGLTYHFIAQDSVYSLRVDSAKVVGGDSVFVFNNIARKRGIASGPTCSGSPAGLAFFAVNANNQLGAQMLKKPSGDYSFKTAQGQEYLLKTKVGTGQTWTFNATANLTATLTSKGIEQVATLTDSVFTYMLSNGKVVKLSKNYGFIAVPNFITYTDNYFRPKDLTFYSIPEKGIGQQISSPFAIFDFQPGDKFSYYLKRETLTTFSNTCLEEWSQKEILSRQNSLNGDTIYYTIQEQKLTKGYGSAGDPWCSAPTATTLHPATTYMLMITKDYEPITNALSNGYYGPSQFTYGGGRVVSGIFRNTQFKQREQLITNKYNYEPCSKTFSGLIDVGGSYTFLRGLGAAKIEDYSSNSIETTILEAYIKGAETYGTWRTLAQILATKKELDAKPLVNAFPNPFTNELSLKFNNTFKGGNATVLISNTLGQEVYRHQLPAAPNQETNLQLPKMPIGLYLLQVTQNEKTYTTRLVRE